MTRKRRGAATAPDTELDVPYGVDPDKEAWIPLPFGGAFAFANKDVNPNGTDYVRVLAANGGEIVYWTADEWRDDPEVVMGAICGAMLHNEDLDPKQHPETFYRFGPKARFPEGIDAKPYAGDF